MIKYYQRNTTAPDRKTAASCDHYKTLQSDKSVFLSEREEEKTETEKKGERIRWWGRERDRPRDLMRGPKEMERWLRSNCYWGKRKRWERGSGWEKWKCLIFSFICLLNPPSIPSSSYRPLFLLPANLLLSSHFLSTLFTPFLFSSSPPALFPSPLLSYIFNMHSSVTRSDVSYNNKLPHLLPLFLQLPSLFSPLLLYLLHLPSPLNAAFPSPALLPPPPYATPHSAGLISFSFSLFSYLLSSSVSSLPPLTLRPRVCLLVLWPLKNCWSNSAAHPIIDDSRGGEGRREGWWEGHVVRWGRVG